MFSKIKVSKLKSTLWLELGKSTTAKKGKVVPNVLKSRYRLSAITKTAPSYSSKISQISGCSSAFSVVKIELSFFFFSTQAKPKCVPSSTV
ncbi:hypothetical protein D3C71_1636600 [compost metagenome]